MSIMRITNLRAVYNGTQKGGNAMKKEIPEATNIGGIRILTVRDVAEILNISIGKAHSSMWYSELTIMPLTG